MDLNVWECWVIFFPSSLCQSQLIWIFILIKLINILIVIMVKWQVLKNGMSWYKWRDNLSKKLNKLSLAQEALISELLVIFTIIFYPDEDCRSSSKFYVFMYVFLILQVHYKVLVYVYHRERLCVFNEYFLIYGMNIITIAFLTQSFPVKCKPRLRLCSNKNNDSYILK